MRVNLGGYITIFCPQLTHIWVSTGVDIYNALISLPEQKRLKMQISLLWMEFKINIPIIDSWHTA